MGLGDSTEPPASWAGNAFGLEYDPNTYTYELTTDEEVFCGGDGGHAACGGWGAFSRALPLATAFRYPEPDPLREFASELGLVRPVIRLS